MKLAILSTMLKKFGRKGYYNSQELGLARALTAMGHRVIVYKGIEDKSQVEDVELEERLTVHYIYMPGVGAHGLFRASRMDRDFDGLLCFSDQQIFIRHIYAFCRKNRIAFVPYIGTAHSYYGKSLHGRIMDFVFSITTLPLYRRLPLLAKTEDVRQELIDLGIPSKRVRLAPVGLDFSVMKEDFQSYDRDKLREEFGFGPDDVILCNVARLQQDKRTLDLLKILRKARKKKKFRLLIVGEGELRQAVDQRIAEYGLHEEVRIIDRIPYEDMWKVYRISDYYLNLSKTEIFGMAVMEAVYYQISVAALRANGPSLTLNGMKGHRLCDSDREVYDWICRDYPSGEDLSWSARKLIQDFSWNTTARAFVDLVERYK